MTSDPWARGRVLTALPASEGPTRFSFPFTSRHITASLPVGQPGSYLLLDRTGRPVYVGRSDQCLRRRLLGHPLRKKATHFTAAVADGPRGAYLLECYWWHRYRRDGIELANLIHPATYDLAIPCPFCIPTAAINAA